MDFHIPSLMKMNEAFAFGRLGAVHGGTYFPRGERPSRRDRSHSAVASMAQHAIAKPVSPPQPSLPPQTTPTRCITPQTPRLNDLWTTAETGRLDGRDFWVIDNCQSKEEDSAMAFFSFNLEQPCDIGLTLSMRAADPGPSAFEIIVTGHVISRHYTVVDRFISRTFTIPASVLSNGRNALSISTIPGYHGIWIESAGVSPLG
ncbi:hypothetical protein GE253_04335 [Niveispirillum sp. SYP-B3756]|uniref:hypothetical protein n=1 Tax=Niveispirillum sp. SYP-B3756 TaxID=2662178 RepID=UPI001290F21B|nr:hypothetical protein [Niveispirillum sp. SYP-B3756]MQP64568.1 hypothetical protein [Niveispirillum sp. SYP-B3756]